MRSGPPLFFAARTVKDEVLAAEKAAGKSVCNREKFSWKEHQSAAC